MGVGKSVHVPQVPGGGISVTGRRAPAFKLSFEEISDFVHRSPFTHVEILRLHARFQAMSRDGLDRLSLREILQIEEMRANPFSARIVELFSGDGSSLLTFDRFVEMMGAFSPRTDPEEKTIWAFALWDFDGDDVIGPEDIKRGLDLVTNSKRGFSYGQSGRGRENQEEADCLSSSEMEQLASRVAQEIDPDNWGLTYFDFRSIISRMPNFINNFRIHL